MGVLRQKSNIFFLWIFFFIYPLGALIVAIKNYRFKEYRIFILLFFLFLGYTYIPIPNSDGSRCKEDFELAVRTDFLKFSRDISTIFDGTSDIKDYYFTIITYFVSNFTADSKIYFLILAFIYFTIFLKLIQALWDLCEINKNRHVIYLIAIFFILPLISGINNVRFPLAFWLFSYGAIQLILKDQVKYLIIAILSVLVHFSLGFSCIFLFIYYVSRYFSNKKVLIFCLLVVFILITAFPKLIAAFLGDSAQARGGQDKFEAYSDDSYISDREEHIEKWNWYIQLNFFTYYYFIIITILLTKLKRFKIIFDQKSERLFGFSIVIIIHSLLMSTILDPISNRYNNLVSLFGFIYLYYLSYINPDLKFFKVLKNILIPILILNILVKLRVDLYSISPVVVFGNVVTAFLYESTVSIQDFLLN